MSTAAASRRAWAAWEPVLWLLAAAAVWATVGWMAALMALLLLVLDRAVWPDRRVLPTAAVVLLVAVPFAWFLGSSLPLFPPSPRLNDNLLAHHVGGLAIWVLFLAAVVDVLSARRNSA